MSQQWIPKKYRRANLANVEEQFAGPLREILDGWPKGLLLEGGNGVGKTYAACALAHAAYGLGLIHRPAIYTPAAELREIMTIEDTFRNQSGFETLRTAGLLIIDDLGKENRATDYRQDVEVAAIGRVLRSRLQAERPTFITTNMDTKALEEVYGKSIYSLLHEVADVWLVMRGPDRRV